MSEATLLEKLVKMGLPLDAAYTEGQFQYVIDAALRRAKAEAKAEGLRQAKQYVERQIKIGEDLIGRPDPNIQRRVALDEIIEYCDEHIATLIDARAAQIEAEG